MVSCRGAIESVIGERDIAENPVEDIRESLVTSANLS